MASYYYTEADRALAEIAANDLRGRLVFDAEAKRGQRWKLDGENKTWQELMAFFDAWGREGVGAEADARSLNKLENRIHLQGFLKLLVTLLE